MTPTTISTTAITPPSPTPEAARAAWKATVFATIDVLIRVVSARLIVLIAVVGGIVLTSIALASPDPMRLGALAIYAASVVVPSVWLASRH